MANSTAEHPIQTDANGNKFRIKYLKEKQTDDAKLGHLRTHYSDHPSRALTPQKLADILLGAEQGNIIAQCELAEDMEEKDGHVFAELQKRRRALLGVDWKLVPPRNASASEKKDTDMLQEHFEDMLFLDDVIFDASDAILKGFSNQEITWKKSGSIWLPESVDFKDPSWFMTHPAQEPGQNRNELRLRDNTVNGEALQPFGWISHTHKTKSGYLARSGLARVLAWPYLFKNYSVRDLAEFLEIYGLPLRLGKYPTGASQEEKNTLLNAVMSIGHNAGGIIPKGMEIDFQEAAKGTQQPFEYMVGLMEKTISKAILGGTLTSQADGKSSTNALGNVHNEVRQELRDSDLKQISNTLSRDLVLPMYAKNGKSFTSFNRQPRFEFDITEAEDLKAFSDSLPALVDVGFKIPVRWAHEKLQIPEPQKDEAVLARAAAPVNTQGVGSTSGVQDEEKAKLKALTKITALKTKAKKEVAQDPITQFTQQLATSMQPAMQGMMSEVMQLIDQVSSLEELQQLLASAEISTDTAINTLQQGLVASELAGMLSVEDESE
jgi:phage gp29-like protein